MSKPRCHNRARGDGGVLQCTLDPDHDGIHHSGAFYWSHGDTDATRGEPAEIVMLECVHCGAVPMCDEQGELTGWGATSVECVHSLTKETA